MEYNGTYKNNRELIAEIQKNGDETENEKVFETYLEWCDMNGYDIGDQKSFELFAEAGPQQLLLTLKLIPVEQEMQESLNNILNNIFSRNNVKEAAVAAETTPRATEPAEVAGLQEKQETENLKRETGSEVKQAEQKEVEEKRELTKAEKKQLKKERKKAKQEKQKQKAKKPAVVKKPKPKMPEALSNISGTYQVKNEDDGTPNLDVLADKISNLVNQNIRVTLNTTTWSHNGQNNVSFSGGRKPWEPFVRNIEINDAHVYRNRFPKMFAYLDPQGNVWSAKYQVAYDYSVVVEKWEHMDKLPSDNALFLNDDEEVIEYMREHMPYMDKFAEENNLSMDGRLKLLVAPELEQLSKAGYAFADYILHWKITPTDVQQYHRLCQSGRNIKEIFKTDKDVYSVLKDTQTLAVWDTYRKMYKQDKLNKESIEYCYSHGFNEGQLNEMSKIMNRKYQGKNVFSFEKLVNYLARVDMYEAIPIDEALPLLNDYLINCEAMAMKPRIDGDSLKREHDVAARIARTRRQELTEEQKKDMTTACRDLARDDYQESIYSIRGFRDADDIYDNANQMHNCTAGYVTRVMNGYDYIYVLYETAHPEVNVANIQINKERTHISQKFLKYNEPIRNRSMTEFIERWQKLARQRYATKSNSIMEMLGKELSEDSPLLNDPGDTRVYQKGHVYKYSDGFIEIRDSFGKSENDKKYMIYQYDKDHHLVSEVDPSMSISAENKTHSVAATIWLDHLVDQGVVRLQVLESVQNYKGFCDEVDQVNGEGFRKESFPENVVPLFHKKPEQEKGAEEVRYDEFTASIEVSTHPYLEAQYEGKHFAVKSEGGETYLEVIDRESGNTEHVDYSRFSANNIDAFKHTIYQYVNKHASKAAAVSEPIPAAEAVKDKNQVENLEVGDIIVVNGHWMTDSNFKRVYCEPYVMKVRSVSEDSVSLEDAKEGILGGSEWITKEELKQTGFTWYDHIPEVNVDVTEFTNMQFQIKEGADAVVHCATDFRGRNYEFDIHMDHIESEDPQFNQIIGDLDDDTKIKLFERIQSNMRSGMSRPAMQTLTDKLNTAENRQRMQGLRQQAGNIGLVR